jgi:hypothetical protein
MILLLSLPLLGQAGVKRLHPTLRRIRRHDQRSVSFAPLNNQVLCHYFAFTAPPFSIRRRLRNQGRKSEPMYNHGNLSSHPPAALQSGTCTFSLATSVFELPVAEPQSPGTFILKEKPTCEALAGNRELRTRSGRDSVFFCVSLDRAPVAEACRKKPLLVIRVFLEPCFFCVARQPQQP